MGLWNTIRDFNQHVLRGWSQCDAFYGEKVVQEYSDGIDWAGSGVISWKLIVPSHTTGN